MNTELTPTFDYTQIESGNQARLQALAFQGRSHLRRTKEEIIAFGEVLLEAKALLPHGSFRSWAAAEFGIPDSTLTYAMRKARGGDIELENVNIGILPGSENGNVLPEHAESQEEEISVKEDDPLASIFFLELLARGQAFYEAKIGFQQRGMMAQWDAWCSQRVEIAPHLAEMYITIYETFLKYPEKAPGKLFPMLSVPLMILIGEKLSKHTKEEVEAICLYADWLHGIALLQDGKPADMLAEEREELLAEGLEGLHEARKHAGVGWFCLA